MQGYFSKYKERIFLHGDSVAEQQRQRLARNVSLAFANAPDYIVVQINGADVGCRVVDDKTTRQGYRSSSTMKTLIFESGTLFETGNYVDMDNQKWLITDFINDVIPKAHIQLCNNVLKFIDDAGAIVEYPAFVQNKSLYTTGVDGGRIISIPDSKITVGVAFNEDTSKLARDKRFLFGRNGKYFAYKLTLIDIATIPGLALLVMEEDAIQPEDNLELGIADYNRKVDPSPTPTDIIITGDNSIRVGMVNTYTADSEVIWTLTNEDGSPTSYASIIESSSLQCKVEAGSTPNKKIVLTAISVADETVSASLIISIKSLF